MSPQVFGVALVISAAVLALWIYVRFPKLAPEQMLKIVLHAATAFVLLHFVSGVIDSVAGGPRGTVMVAVLGVGLPSIAYSFLVGIWMIKLFQGAQSGMR
jgi:hypothetical protein